MAGEQDVLGFINARRRERRIQDISVNALHQAAVRLADFRKAGPLFKTRDLVNLLLSHGARTWRASQPVVRIRLKVCDPQGRPAVRICFD